MAAILHSGPCGLIIPELTVSLVLLLLRVPLQLVESDCVPLFGDLIEVFDQFNRLASEAYMEDEMDLSWSDSTSKDVFFDYIPYNWFFRVLYISQISSKTCFVECIFVNE